VRFELEAITAGYGDTVAVREVSLVVPEGRVIALLGPNGAGKTTLLKVASGLLGPSQGRVLVDGVDVTGAPPERLSRLGVCHVTEGRSVFPSLTVRENLRMFAARGGSESASIERAVTAFPKLGQRLGQIAGTLSGGEQQMLALSRAYAQRAPLVMLDEVSMGLAPIIVDEIFEFFRLLVTEGTSLLLVEQYVAKALAVSDTVYVLVRGRIAFAGESAELIDGDIFAQYLGHEAGQPSRPKRSRARAH
jgi:branched-chain amino acid transport system ATP-binding protein